MNHIRRDVARGSYLPQPKMIYISHDMARKNLKWTILAMMRHEVICLNPKWTILAVMWQEVICLNLQLTILAKMWQEVICLSKKWTILAVMWQEVLICLNTKWSTVYKPWHGKRLFASTQNGLTSTMLLTNGLITMLPACLASNRHNHVTHLVGL